MTSPIGWSPSDIAAHCAAALELLAAELRRTRRPVPGWVPVLAGLCRRWASADGPAREALMRLPDAPLLLSYDQVADRLGCSVSTVERRVADGVLRAVRDGRQVRVRTADLDCYVAALAPVDLSQGGHEGSGAVNVSGPWQRGGS